MNLTSEFVCVFVLVWSEVAAKKDVFQERSHMTSVCFLCVIWFSELHCSPNFVTKSIILMRSHFQLRRRVSVINIQFRRGMHVAQLYQICPMQCSACTTVASGHVSQTRTATSYEHTNDCFGVLENVRLGMNSLECCLERGQSYQQKHNHESETDKDDCSLGA